MSRTRIRPSISLDNTSNYDDNKDLSARTDVEIQPQTLGDDLDYLRTLLKEAKGTTNWYDEPITNLSDIQVAIGDSFNLIENPNGGTTLDKSQTNDVQDWIDSGTGTTSSITTISTEIPLYPNFTNAIKILNDGSGSDYTRYRFTIPESLKSSENILLSMYTKTIGAYSTGDFSLELYYNSSADYLGSYTQVIFNDNFSGDIPASDKKVSTVFNPSNQTNFELRITRTTGTADTGIGINEFRIVPIEFKRAQFVNVADSVTSNYTVGANDYLVPVDTTSLSSDATITLPSAASGQGRAIVVSDTGGQASLQNKAIIVTASGSDTIVGESSVTIDGNYYSLTFISDGTSKWIII